MQLKDMTAELVASQPEKIPAPLPSPFNLKQIVYRELSEDSTGAPRYRRIDKPTPANSSTNIENFVKQIALSGYHRNEDDAEENAWLDIPISRDSYVIIELAPGQSWTFTTKVNLEGIMLKPPTPDHPDPYSHYGRLQFVDIHGVIHPNPAPNCRIAYFAAKKMINAADEYSQGLYYVVDWPGGTHVFVDPEVRFPGSGES